MDEVSSIYSEMEERYFGSEMHEAGEIRRLPSVLDGVNVFVDVGASLGQYSYFAGKALTNATIYCIEADPGKAKHLEHLTEGWSAEQANTFVVVNKGCSDTNEELEFFLPKDRDTSGAFFPLDGSGSESATWDRISVPCVTLDELFADKQVDFIKVDVEGAELRVMRGAQELLKRCSPTVLLEVAPWGDMQRDLKPSAMFLFMAEQGYDFKVFENHWLFTRSRSPWRAALRARLTGFVVDRPAIKEPLKRAWIGLRRLSGGSR